MSIDIKSMFDSIKESLNNEKSKGGGAYKNILALKPGNTYLVRLLPNITDPKDTFYHYYHHGWTSNQTGQYVDALCPTTWNERCPICEERFKLYKKGTDRDKALSSLIRRMEKHLVNVLVIEDPTNEDNNNTVKVLRAGVRLYEKIEAAIEGDDADEFGSRVFDLTENGCNFKIKAETTQDGKKQFTNYNNSRFTSPTAIPGMTPENIKEVYDSLYKLEDLLDRKPTDELKEMLKVHVFCEEGTKKVTEDISEITSDPSSSNVEQTEEPEEKVTTKTKKSSKTTLSNDEKIKDLLAGIDELED